MLRRPKPDLPYIRLKDWADSGEALTARCAACAAEARLSPATLVSRYGWHGPFAKAVSGVSCAECGGATRVMREDRSPGNVAPSATVRT